MPSFPRVLILSLHYPPEPTGSAPYSGELARGLRERGVPARVIAGHPHYPEWSFREGYGKWTSQERIGGVHVTRLRHYLPGKSTGLRRLLSELSFGLRQIAVRWGSPDVVVMSSPALFATALAVIRARLTPSRPRVVIWVQDLYGLGVSETGQGGGILGSVVARVESAVLRAASTVVVIHDRFGKHIEHQLGVDPRRIEVVRNWTHLVPNSGPPPDLGAVRERHGWGTDETIVLHAGNMGAKQGLENVIDAARIAESERQPLRFVLLGDGNRREALEQRATGIEAVQFIDPLDDDGFRDALLAADILLVNEKPGISEMSVPSKLTSYFDTGKPVVAASEPDGITAQEIVAAGAGVVVRSGHPVQLVEACLAIRSNPDAAARFGAAGRRYRHDVLGSEAALDRFARILTSSARADSPLH